MNSKAQRHESYASLKVLLVVIYKRNNLRMNFETELSKSKDWRGVEYNSTIFVGDPFTKMVYYESVFRYLTVDQLGEVLIEAVIRYYSLSDSMVIDPRLQFTFYFCTLFCFYLHVKRQFNTISHLQTDM